MKSDRCQWGRHKLCAFYFLIGNLEENYLSQLKHIHLALLFRYEFIKKHKNYVNVLKLLLDNTHKLHSKGILVNLNGYHHRLYGALATVSTDNLSAHSLA